MIWLAPAGAFLLTLALIAATLKWRWHWAMDHPNERSLHSDPTPRTGGVALIVGVLVSVAIASPWIAGIPWPAFALALALAGISLADDRGGLPVRLRLGAHLLAAAVFAAYLTQSAAPWWWMLGITVAVGAAANFFNFMDGANGLAGGMAVAGFSCYGIAAMSAAALPVTGFSMFCFAVAAAAAGFLCFNLTGRVFMGDGGSVPVGFLAGAIGVDGALRGAWPWWFPLLVFAPFLADALLTLSRRVLRGERFWQAHREHYYQRMVRTGWTHRRLAIAEYGLMLACGAGALAARQADPAIRWLIVGALALVFSVVCALVDYRWRRFQAGQGETP